MTHFHAMMGHLMRACYAEGHDTVRCLQVDQYKIAVGYWDGVIQVYDQRTYRPFEVLKYRNILYCMQMDECRLFTGSHGAHPCPHAS